MSPKKIASVDDLIGELGGQTRAAEVFGTSPQNIAHWQKAGRMPAKFYLAHQARLAERGIMAPATLWSFVPPENFNRDHGDEAPEGARPRALT